MTIQYQPSAAGLSWAALSEALDNRAVMEKALFQMFGDSIHLSISETETQATNILTEMNAAANQQMVSGIMAIGGAIASLAVTGFTTYKSNAALKQNESSIDNEVTLEKKVTPELPNDIELNALPSNDNSRSAIVEATPGTTTEGGAKAPVSTKINGQNSAEADSPLSDKTGKTKEDDKVDADKARQKHLQDVASQWMQNGTIFSPLANQVLNSGVSSIAQSTYISTQGEAKAQEAIAQALSAVLNSQGGLLTSALSSCDSYMQNTNGTISAIIQASSVRG